MANAIQVFQVKVLSSAWISIILISNSIFSGVTTDVLIDSAPHAHSLWTYHQMYPKNVIQRTSRHNILCIYTPLHWDTIKRRVVISFICSYMVVCLCDLSRSTNELCVILFCTVWWCLEVVSLIRCIYLCSIPDNIFKVYQHRSYIINNNLQATIWKHVWTSVTRSHPVNMWSQVTWNKALLIKICFIPW